MSLFAPDQLPIKATIARQIACVERELRLRRHVFPRRVLEGRLTQTKATEEIALMEAVRETLLAAQREYA